MPVKGRSKEALTWTCSACGADNDDALQFCSDCGGERAGDVAIPQTPEVDKFEDRTFEDKTLLPEPSPEPSPEPEKIDEAEEAAEEEETEVEPLPSTVISSPLSVIETAPEAPSQSPPEVPSQTVSEPPSQTTLEVPVQTAPQAPSQTMGQGRYYIVFVNTPAQSLIKSKVPIELDIFPVVSIGRSPENVIVIPDQEVSRVHAELTTEGTKLLLKDLKSKNGTYVYDGKKFEQVTDSVEVKPNSILKFGTGTIVRLVSE